MRTVNGRTDRVVVVGAGLSGLAAALHLAGRGRSVTVLERDAVPGGRVGRHDLGGYRVDTGPTVLTMPSILEETLNAVGSSAHDLLDLMPLTPAYRAHFADGSTLDVLSDGEAMAEAVREFAGPREAAGYQRLRRWLTRLYAVEYERFIAANFDSPLSLLTPTLARLVAMGAFGSLDGAVGRFLTDERLRRVFSFQALYAGESPHRALAVYGVIPYMDTIAGVYFPRGGMRAVPDALAAAATSAGVEFHYGSAVDHLERSGARVTAVRTTAGERFECDAVVLTTEPAAAYGLLGRTPRRPTRLRASPSAVVVHMGTTARWPGTAHHSLSFGQAWKPTFDEIIHRGAVMSDPSLLVTRPTASDPALAPPDRDLLYLLAPVPNLAVGAKDWEREGKAYAEEVVAVAERRLFPGLAASVEASHLVTPADWAAMGMTAGTPFSYAHSLTQTGPFRPGNFPRHTDNAVLAGSGTVPGVGVPTALVSGRLAADRITGV
ncbi:phytoene desaturase family protein [Actinokineospora sp. G85]|uniref:phytoene desaturase family protein n=1 Tax=Actinokineospora sp. G85 TaxID=3406626 RepID=UPI003C71D913